MRSRRRRLTGVCVNTPGACVSLKGGTTEYEELNVDGPGVQSGFEGGRKGVGSRMSGDLPSNFPTLRKEVDGNRKDPGLTFRRRGRDGG